MDDKIINGRLCIKSDTESNWNNSTLPLRDGEVVLNKTNGELRFGDGHDTYKNSPSVKTRPLNHTSSSTEFGGATSELYGHVKMSGNGNAESDTVLSYKSIQFISDLNSVDLLQPGIYQLNVGHSTRHLPCGCLPQSTSTINGILSSVTVSKTIVKQSLDFPTIELSYYRYINGSDFDNWRPLYKLDDMSETYSYFPILTELPVISTNEWQNINGSYSPKIQIDFSTDSELLYKGNYYTYNATKSSFYQDQKSDSYDITGICKNCILKYKINIVNHTFEPIFYPTDDDIKIVRQSVSPHRYIDNGTTYLELPCMYLRESVDGIINSNVTSIEFSYLTDLYLNNNTIKVATSGETTGIYPYRCESPQSELNTADIILSIDYGQRSINNYKALKNFIQCIETTYVTQKNEIFAQRDSNQSLNIKFLSGKHFLSSDNASEYTIDIGLYKVSGIDSMSTTLDLGSSKLGIKASVIQDINIYHHPVTAGTTAYVTKYMKNVTIYGIASSNDYKIFTLAGATMENCIINCDHACGEGLPTGLINSTLLVQSTITNNKFFGIRVSLGNSCIATNNKGALITIPTGVSGCIITNNVMTTVTNSSSGGNIVENNLS